MIGLGYRREFAEEFLHGENIKPDFIELAPENWMEIGGYWKKQFDRVAEKYTVFAHGLSLSIGSPEPLDTDFLKNVKVFLDQYNISIYSEHLSFAKCDNAHMYDLLPVPFRRDAVKHIAQRVRQVQDFLERELVLEIVSYYTPVAAEMDEAAFITSVAEESGCGLLLDVNNVYVNAFNHHYNAYEFIEKLPLDKVRYIHMAGHKKVSDDLIIDTHGEAIIDEVYNLFGFTLSKIKPVPVLLERDFNIPQMEELQMEMTRMRNIFQNTYQYELTH